MEMIHKTTTVYFVRPSELVVQQVDCPSSNHTQRVEYGDPWVAQLKAGSTGNFTIEYQLGSLYPTLQNQYRLNFTSFYETEVKLPTNAVITYDNSQVCTISHEPFSKVYLYDTVFSLKP
jgi:hypothetical protein